MHQKPGQRAHRQLPEAFALRKQPFLEPGLGHGQAGQQVAPIQLARLLERRGRPLGHAPLEQDDVDLDRGGIERDDVPLGDQDRQRGERLSEHEQRLPEVGPRLRLTQVAPQQCRQLVARVGLAWRQSQIPEERLDLSGRDTCPPSRVPSRLEAA
jgi:hypothetical protein